MSERRRVRVCTLAGSLHPSIYSFHLFIYFEFFFPFFSFFFAGPVGFASSRWPSGAYIVYVIASTGYSGDVNRALLSLAFPSSNLNVCPPTLFASTVPFAVRWTVDTGQCSGVTKWHRTGCYFYLFTFYVFVFIWKCSAEKHKQIRLLCAREWMRK